MATRLEQIQNSMTSRIGKISGQESKADQAANIALQTATQIASPASTTQPIAKQQPQPQTQQPQAPSTMLMTPARQQIQIAQPTEPAVQEPLTPLSPIQQFAPSITQWLTPSIEVTPADIAASAAKLTAENINQAKNVPYDPVYNPYWITPQSFDVQDSLENLRWDIEKWITIEEIRQLYPELETLNDSALWELTYDLWFDNTLDEILTAYPELNPDRYTKTVAMKPATDLIKWARRYVTWVEEDLANKTRNDFEDALQWFFYGAWKALDAAEVFISPIEELLNGVTAYVSWDRRWYASQWISNPATDMNIAMNEFMKRIKEDDKGNMILPMYEKVPRITAAIDAVKASSDIILNKAAPIATIVSQVVWDVPVVWPAIVNTLWWVFNKTTDLIGWVLNKIPWFNKLSEQDQKKLTDLWWVWAMVTLMSRNKKDLIKWDLNTWYKANFKTIKTDVPNEPLLKTVAWPLDKVIAEGAIKTARWWLDIADSVRIKFIKKMSWLTDDQLNSLIWDPAYREAFNIVKNNIDDFWQSVSIKDIQNTLKNNVVTKVLSQIDEVKSQLEKSSNIYWEVTKLPTRVPTFWIDNELIDMLKGYGITFGIDPITWLKDWRFSNRWRWLWQQIIATKELLDYVTWEPVLKNIWAVKDFRSWIQNYTQYTKVAPIAKALYKKFNSNLDELAKTRKEIKQFRDIDVNYVDKLERYNDLAKTLPNKTKGLEMQPWMFNKIKREFNETQNATLKELYPSFYHDVDVISKVPEMQKLYTQTSSFAKRLNLFLSFGWWYMLGGTLWIPPRLSWAVVTGLSKQTLDDWSLRSKQYILRKIINTTTDTDLKRIADIQTKLDANKVLTAAEQAKLVQFSTNISNLLKEAEKKIALWEVDLSQWISKAVDNVIAWKKPPTRPPAELQLLQELRWATEPIMQTFEEFRDSIKAKGWVTNMLTDEAIKRIYDKLVAEQNPNLMKQVTPWQNTRQTRQTPLQPTPIPAEPLQSTMPTTEQPPTVVPTIWEAQQPQ